MDVIEALLEGGASLEDVNREGDPPLFMVETDHHPLSEDDKITLLDRLVELGANLRSLNYRGQTFLHRVLKRDPNSVRLAEHIVRLAPDLLRVRQDNEQTPWDLASMEVSLALIRATGFIPPTYERRLIQTILDTGTVEIAKEVASLLPRRRRKQVYRQIFRFDQFIDDRIIQTLRVNEILLGSLPDERMVLDVYDGVLTTLPEGCTRKMKRGLALIAMLGGNIRFLANHQVWKSVSIYDIRNRLAMNAIRSFPRSTIRFLFRRFGEFALYSIHRHFVYPHAWEEALFRGLDVLILLNQEFLQMEDDDMDTAKVAEFVATNFESLVWNAEVPPICSRWNRRKNTSRVLMIRETLRPLVDSRARYRSRLEKRFKDSELRGLPFHVRLHILEHVVHCPVHPMLCSSYV